MKKNLQKKFIFGRIAVEIHSHVPFTGKLTQKMLKAVTVSVKFHFKSS